MERNGAGGVPQAALDYLHAVRRYYGEGEPRTKRPPQDPDIAAMLHVAPRTWQRYKRDLRTGRWGGRDWIEVWPPPADWHPSWEELLPLQPPLPESDDGLIHLTYEEVYDRNGKLVERRLRPPFNRLSAVAVGLALGLLLDLSDGRLDGTFHICKLLVERVPSVT